MFKRVVPIVIIFAVLLLFFLLERYPEKNPSDLTESGNIQQDSTFVSERDSVEEKQWGDAPDFTAPRLNGGEFTLSSLEDNVIVLNFWAVGCDVCGMQIPKLSELYEKYGDKGVEFIGVCLNTESVVRKYEGLGDINYTLILMNREVALGYGRYVRFIPVTLVIDSAGNISKKYVGYVAKSVLGEKIEELLKKDSE